MSEPGERIGAHDSTSLGAYALGVLDPEETRAVELHLASCAACRLELAGLDEARAMLGEVPPEVFLDGPPDGGDLMLQRTLRRVRTESTRGDRQRMALVAASVAVLVAAALGSGVLVGRGTAGSQPAQVAPPSAAPASTSPVPGVRTATVKDLRTGVVMTTSVTPAAGWVRVHAKVDGVAAGKKCRLVVVARDGSSVEAGSWLVSPKGEMEGTSLDGAALVAPAEVASVDVVTFDGERLVSVPV